MTVDADEDLVSFFQPRGLVFTTLLWVYALVWAAAEAGVLGVAAALGRHPQASVLVGVAERTLVGPTVAAALTTLLLWRRLGWLHTSHTGLTFAATGRRAVHLDWAAVADVRLRRRGPFTELLVVPTEPARAAAVPGPGGRPRARRLGGRTTYLVDVGLMSPGPRVLLAELHRRVPARV